MSRSSKENKCPLKEIRLHAYCGLFWYGILTESLTQLLVKAKDFSASLRARFVASTQSLHCRFKGLQIDPCPFANLPEKK